MGFLLSVHCVALRDTVCSCEISETLNVKISEISETLNVKISETVKLVKPWNPESDPHLWSWILGYDRKNINSGASTKVGIFEKSPRCDKGAYRG